MHVRTMDKVSTVKHVKALKLGLRDRLKAVLLLWIYVTCFSLLCCLVCSLQPCDHLLGKG